MSTRVKLHGEGIRVRAGQATLLDEVSVSFVAGTVGLLVGPNGAGKSTLMRVLARQLAPERGAVRYEGEPAEGWRGEALARVRAVLSQHVEVTFPLRVSEVVMLGRSPHFTGAPTSRDAAVCAEAMRRLDVLDWADRDYLTLSGGERQRVQFARVLAQIWPDGSAATRWLLLDEPLTFLDIRHQFEFLRLVRALVQEWGIGVVGVVHDLGLAARYADHLVMLGAARVVAAGPPASVLTADRVDEIFGVRPTVRRGDDGRPRLEFE